MVRRLIILIALLLAPALARADGITPELVADGPGRARLLAESGRCRTADGRDVAVAERFRGRAAALPGADEARDQRPDELRLRARLCGAGEAQGAGRRARAHPD